MIRSEFCANTGYHRKYAIWLLNGPRPEKRPAAQRGHGASFSRAAVWEAAGYPWSQRPKTHKTPRH